MVGGCLLFGGAGPRRVPGPGGLCLAQRGVPGPGGCLVLGECLVPGECLLPRGCLVLGGVPGPRGVSAPGGICIPACTEAEPPVNRITHTCKNITLPQLRCRR